MNHVLRCVIMISLFTGVLSPGNKLAHGKDLFDRHGVTLIYGTSKWTNMGPDPGVDYEWTTASYVLTKDITSWFSLETQIGAGYLEADNGGDSPSAELRLLGDVHYSWFFLQLGSGLARIFNIEALPGLAESKIHSILSGTMGLRFPIPTGTRDPMEITLGYGVEHLSAISKNGAEGDTGWNTGGPRVTITWVF